MSLVNVHVSNIYVAWLWGKEAKAVYDRMIYKHDKAFLTKAVGNGFSGEQIPYSTNVKQLRENEEGALWTELKSINWILIQYAISGYSGKTAKANPTRNCRRMPIAFMGTEQEECFFFCSNLSTPMNRSLERGIVQKNTAIMMNPTRFNTTI